MAKSPPAPRRPPERIHLAPVYWLLILLIVLATAGSIVWGDVVLVGRFGPNLATESLGILLTVFFVRRFMEHAERARRLRASAGALRKSRVALQEMIDAWSATVKGCMETNQTTFGSRAALITPDRSEWLLSLDPAARRPDHPAERWLDWLTARVRHAQDTLDQIVGTYGGILDPEYVEAVDALVADPFLSGFRDLAGSDIGVREWRVAMNAVRGLRSSHFERLLGVIALHNGLAGEVGRVRGSSAAPRSSLIGVELARDHDLTVDATVDDGWWRSPPHVGSLRPS